MQCSNNQKEIANAAIQFETAKQKMPGSWAMIANGNGGHVPVTWPVLLMPYSGRNDVYNLILQNGYTVFPTTSPTPMISLYICPTAPPRTAPAALSDLRGELRPTGQYGSPTGTPFDYQESGVFFNQIPVPNTTTWTWQTTGSFFVTATGAPTPLYPIVTTSMSYIAKYGDGTSNTLMFSENLDAQSWWEPALATYDTGYAPEFNPFNGALNANTSEWSMGLLWTVTNSPSPGLNSTAGVTPVTGLTDAYARPSSSHADGFNAAMCDGSVKYLSQAIQYRVYANLMSANGNACKVPGSASPGTLQTTNYASLPSPVWTTTTTSGAVLLIPVSETDLNP